jgi:CRISPR-associated protein Cas2
MDFDSYIIAYDIADAKRLNKMAKFLEGYLRRVQKSVFQGKLTGAQLVEVRDGIKDIMDAAVDSVAIYPLTKMNLDNIEWFGKQPEDAFVIG